MTVAELSVSSTGLIACLECRLLTCDAKFTCPWQYYIILREIKDYVLCHVLSAVSHVIAAMNNICWPTAPWVHLDEHHFSCPWCRYLCTGFWSWEALTIRQLQSFPLSARAPGCTIWIDLVSPKRADIVSRLCWAPERVFEINAIMKILVENSVTNSLWQRLWTLLRYNAWSDVTDKVLSSAGLKYDQAVGMQVSNHLSNVGMASNGIPKDHVMTIFRFHRQEPGNPSERLYATIAIRADGRPHRPIVSYTGSDSSTEQMLRDIVKQTSSIKFRELSEHQPSLVKDVIEICQQWIADQHASSNSRKMLIINHQTAQWLGHGRRKDFMQKGICFIILTANSTEECDPLRIGSKKCRNKIKRQTKGQPLKDQIPVFIREIVEKQTARNGFKEAGIFDKIKCCQQLSVVVEKREAKTGFKLIAARNVILTTMNSLPRLSP